MFCSFKLVIKAFVDENPFKGIFIIDFLHDTCYKK